MLDAAPRLAVPRDRPALGRRGRGHRGRPPGPPASTAKAVASVLKGRRFDGLHVVLDCANGAASAIAPEVFDALGARVEAIFDRPDGVNINDGCGSTHPEALARTVVERGAALGIAFDGDADRMVAVDHKGTVADGDTLLALFAVDLSDRGLLPGDTVVVTVMTNLGFRLAMAERNIEVVETPVGDRAVLEALESNGFNLGGEQSGHIVFRHLASTGDGLLTGLLLADLVLRSGVGLAAVSTGAHRAGPPGAAERGGARTAPPGRRDRGVGHGPGRRGGPRRDRSGAAPAERDRAGGPGDGRDRRRGGRRGGGGPDLRRGRTVPRRPGRHGARARLNRPPGRRLEPRGPSMGRPPRPH